MDSHPQVPQSETLAAVDELPTMADLDRLEADLDAIDRALADIDQAEEFSQGT